MAFAERALTIEERLAFDLRASWQSRALVVARDTLGAVLLSVLAHNFEDAMESLLKLTFLGWEGIKPPFLCTAGKINKDGAVVADVVMPDGTIRRDSVLYHSERELRDDFRRLADGLKLNDDDRIQMFQAVRNWVTADRRLDPAMDPRDPDAKRLVN